MLSGLQKYSYIHAKLNMKIYSLFVFFIYKFFFNIYFVGAHLCLFSYLTSIFVFNIKSLKKNQPKLQVILIFMT